MAQHLDFRRQHPVTLGDAIALATDCNARSIQYGSYAMGCSPGSRQRNDWLSESEIEYVMSKDFAHLAEFLAEAQ